MSRNEWISVILLFFSGVIFGITFVLAVEAYFPRVCEETVYLPPSDCDCPEVCK